MKKLLWPLLLSVLSINAIALQGPADPDGGPEGAPDDELDGGPDDGPPRWGVGLGTIISESVYAGEGARLIPFPLITYQGENFYFRGITAGWTFVRNDSFEFSAITKFRFDGFSVDDLGRKELAKNGVDYRLLDDRDISLDAGLATKWSGGLGEIELELLADITDTSGGVEASIQYGYPIQIGKGRLTPNLGATWMSEDTANYYYGTLDTEVARGVINYKPDAVVVPHIGFSYFRPMGDKWSLIASAKYSSLPDEIKDSPFVEPDTDSTGSVMIGIVRGF